VVHNREMITIQSVLCCLVFLTMNLMRTVRCTNVLATLILASLFIHAKPARSQQRACVVSDDGVTVCGRPTAVKKGASKPTQVSAYRKEINNFALLVKGCKRVDANIKCDLVVTNKGVERDLSLNPAFIKIIDSVGRSHQCQTVDFGGVGNVTAKITPGIDYAATITFNDIPDQISQAQILEINAGYDVGVFQFRKVSFTN
jgi:hypothetical protein